MAVTFQRGIERNPHIARLVDKIDKDLRSGGQPAIEVAKSVKAMLTHLEPSSLAAGIEATASEVGYVQHCVHLDPDGRFSVILLVWKAGQFTPIHCHRAWGVVSILEGIEEETVYDASGPAGELVVEEDGVRAYSSGQVMFFNPPDDIHRVENVGNGLAMSLHVYGCDYRENPTSIVRCFDDAIEMD